jgi:peptidoglycan/LPS O-acetylase OafA/YrhL
LDKHIDALTGLRAVAVLLVFEAHLQQRYFSFQALQGTALSNTPYFGMTTFFVLSGFVIHWNYAHLFATERPGVAWWNFFVARFSRLYPLHLAVTLVAIYLGGFESGKFVQHLFMVQAWVYQGVSNISYFNTWSVSVEWFFYVVYAAGYPLTARWTRSVSTIWLLIGIVVVGFSSCWIAGPVVTSSDMWLRYSSPYLRLPEFLTGVVAAQIVMTQRAGGRDVLSDSTLLPVIALTIVLYHMPLGQRTGINYLLAPMIAAVLIVVSDRRSIASSALSARWLLWIGDRSYSIYLLEAGYLGYCAWRVEKPFGFSLKQGIPFTWSEFAAGASFSAIGFALVLVASDICWRYFEMPARRAIKRGLEGGLNSLIFESRIGR